jgi:hypothetical protein
VDWIGGKDDLILTAMPVGCDIDVVGVFGHHVKCGFEDCEEGALGWAQAEGDEGCVSDWSITVTRMTNSE